MLFNIVFKYFKIISKLDFVKSKAKGTIFPCIFFICCIKGEGERSEEREEKGSRSNSGIFIDEVRTFVSLSPLGDTTVNMS